MGEQLGSGPAVQRQEDDDPELRSLLALIKAAPPADAPSYFALTFTKADSRQKADLLAACGDLFKQLFLRTRKESYCDDAVKAYELAVSCVPASDPEYLIFLQDVASWRLMRFNLRRDFADLDKAIQGFETVVNNTPDTHRGMPIWLNNLSTALDTRFRRSGDSADLDRAITSQRKVLSLTIDTSDPALPTRLNNLAGLLLAHYEKTGRTELIEQSKSHIERCFQLLNPGHPHMRQCLITRGSIFRLQHERNPNSADINEAIKFYQQAVDLQPIKDPRILASSLQYLGRCYYYRYILEGHKEDIEVAITTQRRGIEMSKSHPDMHFWLSQLSDSFLVRFERGEKIQDIRSAIKAQEEAIDVAPMPDTRSMGKYLRKLAALFFYSYNMTGDLADINHAILLQQKSISLLASPDETYHIHLMGLGKYLLLRFARTQATSDIENAIETAKKAVEVTHEKNVSALQSLGACYFYSFRLCKRHSDRDEAISCIRKAVHLPLSGREREDKHILLSSLSTVLIHGSSHEKNKIDLAEAIELLRSAIQMAPQEHINIPMYLLNLGTCPQSRYKQCGNDEDIDEAMVLHQQAIDLTTEGSADIHLHLWALGRDFYARYTRKGDPSDLLEAIDKFRQATLCPAGPPSVRLEISQWWTASSLILGPEHALTSIESALQLQSQVAGLQETTDARLGRIGRTRRLPTTAAAVAIRIGQFDKAIEWLEQGRCILWNQVNSLRTPLHDLKDHNKELPEDISRVSSGLEKAATRESLSLPVLTEDSESMNQRITEQTKVISQIELGKEWDRLVEKVRDIPRFKDFLRPPRFKDLLKDLPKNGIVVVITVHEDQFEEYNGCDALALVPGSKTAKHIPLEGFSYNRAEVLRRNLQDRLRRHGHRFGQADVDVDRGMRVVAEVGMNLSMQEILKELWFKVVRPILEALEIPCRPSAPQRVWWCLTGPLACFPLHAAGLYGSEAEPGSTATDYVISSCIPTLSTLTDRVRNPRKAPSDAEGLFIVSQPNTPDMPPIPGASAEAELIQSRVKGKISRVLCLEGKEVTIERALEEIQSHSCVHLACHAIQADDGSSSAFYLEDGELDLLEIIKKDIKIADFAFLSACQTSMGSDFFSEEAIHLAAGMLAAGYRGVVATMWSIKDKYGPVVADYFYEHLLGCEKRPQGKVVGSEGAACALHHAIIKLRGELDDSEASFLTWVPYVHLGL